MKKSALLIGINYEGSDLELNGCINDVQNMEKLLLESGFKAENIVVLTDNTDTKPTRKNILRALLELIISDSRELVFHYSGHGSYTLDLSGDEKDHNDECLVPLDHEENTIIDDEIRGLLQLLRPNQRLFVLMDCCHSGTNMDLAYNLFQRYTNSNLRMFKDRTLQETSGQVIMISGCQDTQFSSDAYIDGNYSGAMTASFLKTYRPKIKYDKLIVGMRKYLKDNEFDQIPNLASGRNLNLREQFIL